jgi:hypothetical protein
LRAAVSTMEEMTVSSVTLASPLWAGDVLYASMSKFQDADCNLDILPGSKKGKGGP